MGEAESDREEVRTWAEDHICIIMQLNAFHAAHTVLSAAEAAGLRQQHHHHLSDCVLCGEEPPSNREGSHP